MTVRPKELHGVTSNPFKSFKVERSWSVFHPRTQHTPHGVRLPLASCTRTRAPKQGKRQIGLASVRERQGELVADDGRVFQSRNHWKEMPLSEFTVHPISTFPKNRGTHANMRGPFFYRHFEVAAHSHAQGW